MNSNNWGGFLLFPPVPNPIPAMPLPTYAQSEKYEKDGVLEFGSNQEDDDSDHDVSEGYSDGTCCEFTIFFMSKFPVGFLVAFRRRESRSYSYTRVEPWIV